jgi:hypothetical protein
MQTNPMKVDDDARIDAVLRVMDGTLDWTNIIP